MSLDKSFDQVQILKVISHSKYLHPMHRVREHMERRQIPNLLLSFSVRLLWRQETKAPREREWQAKLLSKQLSARPSHRYAAFSSCLYSRQGLALTPAALLASLVTSSLTVRLRATYFSDSYYFFRVRFCFLEAFRSLLLQNVRSIASDSINRNTRRRRLVGGVWSSTEYSAGCIHHQRRSV